MCSPYADLVWDREWKKIVEQAKSDVNTHIHIAMLQWQVKLKNELNIIT